MGGSILWFRYTFSYGNQFLDWFVYATAAIAAAFEFAGGSICGRTSSILKRWAACRFSSTVLEQMRLNYFLMHMVAVSKNSLLSLLKKSSRKVAKTQRYSRENLAKST
jgi:hypothetical protein